jgi:hypothetical protein
MLQAGCGMLEKLLAADPGYRGPRVPCGQGHEAEFVSCRDQVIDTVLGPVALTRAWYHCGLRARLGPARYRARRGGRVHVARAAGDERPGRCRRAVREGRPAAGKPGWGTADLKRVERAAEASGAAAAGAARERAGLITARKLVPLPPDPLPDKLYAAIDGTGVPVTARERPGGTARARTVAPAPAR